MGLEGRQGSDERQVKPEELEWRAEGNRSQGRPPSAFGAPQIPAGHFCVKLCSSTREAWGSTPRYTPYTACLQDQPSWGSTTAQLQSGLVSARDREGTGARKSGDWRPAALLQERPQRSQLH